MMALNEERQLIAKPHGCDSASAFVIDGRMPAIRLSFAGGEIVLERGAGLANIVQQTGDPGEVLTTERRSESGRKVGNASQVFAKVMALSDRIAGVRVCHQVVLSTGLCAGSAHQSDFGWRARFLLRISEQASYIIERLFATLLFQSSASNASFGSISHRR
jgi:hypothetical protein